MDPTEAQQISTSPDELQDLQDDFVIHQQTEPEPEGEITKDIESNKPKRPRSEKQIAAFEKARKALAEKRAAKAAGKAQNKAKPGRPPKVKSTVDAEVREVPPPTRPTPKKGRKPKVRYVEMMQSSSSDTESSESEPDEVVYVQQRRRKAKGRKQQNKKKQQQQRVIYVDETSSSDDEHEPSPHPPLSSLYSFV